MSNTEKTSENWQKSGNSDRFLHLSSRRAQEVANAENGEGYDTHYKDRLLHELGQDALEATGAATIGGFGVGEDEDGSRRYINLSSEDLGTVVNPERQKALGLPELVQPEPNDVNTSETNESVEGDTTEELSFAERLGTAGDDEESNPNRPAEQSDVISQRLNELGEEAPLGREEAVAKSPTHIQALLDSSPKPPSRISDDDVSIFDIQRLMASPEGGETPRETTEEQVVVVETPELEKTEETSINEVLDSFISNVGEVAESQRGRLQGAINEVSEKFKVMVRKPDMANAAMVALEEFTESLHGIDLVNRINELLHGLMTSNIVEKERNEMSLGAKLGTTEQSKDDVLNTMAGQIKSRLTGFDAELKDVSRSGQLLHDSLENRLHGIAVESSELQPLVETLKSVIDKPEVLKTEITRIVNEAKTAL